MADVQFWIVPEAITGIGESDGRSVQELLSSTCDVLPSPLLDIMDIGSVVFEHFRLPYTESKHLSI